MKIKLTEIHAILLGAFTGVALFLAALMLFQPRVVEPSLIVKEVVIPIMEVTTVVPTEVTTEQTNPIINKCQKVIIEEYDLNTGQKRVVKITERCDD